MVTMKDIAKACQVSVATVSKALNAYSDIGAETREKIKAKAEEMGYYPNSSARALKIMETQHILPADELTGGRKVLRAAALTYVAALASSLLQLLRLILLSQRRSRK